MCVYKTLMLQLVTVELIWWKQIWLLLLTSGWKKHFDKNMRYFTQCVSVEALTQALIENADSELTTVFNWCFVQIWCSCCFINCIL